MKRSEMLKIIQDFLKYEYDFVATDPGNRDTELNRKISANCLLLKIENLGMNPPMWWDEKDPEYGKETWEPES